MPKFKDMYREKKKKRKGVRLYPENPEGEESGASEGIKETADLVKSFAEKSGKSVAEVEKLWKEAKTKAKEEGHDEEYDYIVGIIKKMLSLNESVIDWLQTAIDGYVDLLDTGYTKYNKDINKAITYANKNTSAGKKAKELGLKKFKEQNKINEAYLEENLEDIKEYISYLMIAVAQFHIFHLFVTNGTQHEALGEFYKELQDEVDSLSEQVIAYYNIEEVDEYEAEIMLGYNEEKCRADIQEISDYTTDIIEMVDESENKSIVEELTEIQEACAKLMYKMNLS